MIYDIEDSPILEMLTVNGRLTFDTSADRKLRVKHLFVRTGELIVGTEEEPFPMEAEIILYGEADAASFVYDGAIEAGNKLISNLNLVSMYGTPRQENSYQTRLMNTLDSGMD